MRGLIAIVCVLVGGVLQFGGCGQVLAERTVFGLQDAEQSVGPSSGI